MNVCMALRSINTIKNWFRTGLKPTQSQFWDWMDSFFHKDENIPSEQIEGLQDLLDSKMDKAAVIAPEQVGEYDPAKNYVFDPQLAEYVSFSNPESEDPRFQVEAFYRLKESPGQAGRSPESHPEFWVYQGQTLGDITIGDVIGLREELDDLSQKKSGLIAVVDAGKIGTDFLLEKVDDALVVLVPGQIGIEDGTQTVFYLDITEPSFVVKTGAGFTLSDYKIQPISTGESGASGLPSTWEQDAAAIRALVLHDDGMDVGNYATNAIYEYDAAATAADDGDVYLKPNDVAVGDAGRWVKQKTFSVSGHGHDSSKVVNTAALPNIELSAESTQDEINLKIGAGSKVISFSNGEMLFNVNKYISAHQVTATFHFTKSAGSHKIGAMIEACFVADGVTGHKPTFSADFNVQYDNWDNTNGAKNLVRMRYLPEGILTEIRKI